MKTKILLLACIAAAAISVFVVKQISENTVMAYGNDMFDLNIQALSASENGEFYRYKNVTDNSSNTEFKTEVSTGADGTKVSVEYKRTCTVWYTYCKHTGKKNDVCYQELNGMAQGPCGDWK